MRLILPSFCFRAGRTYTINGTPDASVLIPYAWVDK